MPVEPTADLDIDHLRGWIGRRHVAADTITPRLADSLAAILDGPAGLAAGDVAPAGIHWCLAPDIAPMSALGPDGHPARGGFLPPVPLPRRMWAGGRLRFTAPLRVGDQVERHSRVASVDVKQGRTGTLCFVTVEHDYRVGGETRLREEHDIVYRQILPAAGAKAPAEPATGETGRRVEATPVLLARYSAVTFNGHRIHYDRDYTRDVEHYPGLLVHGPLQATWLLQLAQEAGDGQPPARFAFQAQSPLYDGQAVTAHRRRSADGGHELWVAAANGVVTMTAQATAG